MKYHRHGSVLSITFSMEQGLLMLAKPTLSGDQEGLPCQSQVQVPCQNLRISD
jgi:hypothetical protein